MRLLYSSLYIIFIAKVSFPADSGQMIPIVSLNMIPLIAL